MISPYLAHHLSQLQHLRSILLALVLASLGFTRVDALFGLGIAVYILWSAFTIVREAVAVLMDQELPVEVTERMTELVCSVPGVLGAHDLRSRISGRHWHVQLHVEMPADRGVQALDEAWPRLDALGDIGAAIQTYVEAQHMSVVRDFCGHGLGRLFHDAPEVDRVVSLRDGRLATTVIYERLIAKYRVTTSHMVPTMFHRLLQLPDERRHALLVRAELWGRRVDMSR